MNGELKACPGCKAPAEIKRDHLGNHSLTWIECTKCPMATVRRGWTCADDSIVYALTCAWNQCTPTPAPGALPELIESRLRYLERFSDEGQHKSIPGPYAGPAWELAQDLRMAIPAYARAYAEQCRAGVVVTDAMVERSARKVCEIAMQDWDDIGPFAQSVLMDTQRAALQSAFADDEGIG